MSFWKNKPLIVTIVLIIVLVVLLFATSGYNSKNESDSLIGAVVAPMQEGVYTAANGIGGFFKSLFSVTDLDKENLRLREKIAELEEPVLDMTWEQDGGNHFVCYNGWRVNVTAGVM